MNIPTIRHEEMSEIFSKFHIEGLPFDAVIHRFKSLDTGDFHDHPFSFTTHILSGGYTERIWSINPQGLWSYEDIDRLPGTVHKVKSTDIHKVIGLLKRECYTIMIPGPWERKSGFWRFDKNGARFREWDQPEFDKPNQESGIRLSKLF